MMTLRELAGAGMLAAGVAAAAVALGQGQNQVQISGSGRTDLAPVEQGTVADAGSAALSGAAGANRARFATTGALTLTRLVDGGYEAALILNNPHCGVETIGLTAEVLDRNSMPLAVSLEVRSADGTPKAAPRATWTIDPGAYERIVLRITLPRAPSASGAVAPTPGAFDPIVAALLSTPIDYGDWDGHLPAQGLLVLTRHTKPTDPKALDPNAPDPKAAGGCPTTTVAPATREVKFEPPLPSALDTGVVLTSLILALIISVITATVLAASETSLTSRMGEATLEFGKSWGANVAIGSAILTGITGAGVLPKDSYAMHNTTYVLLTALFAAMVLLGATLYGLIRPPDASVTASQPSEGYVLAYLLSTAVVLWGAIGQVLLLGMIIKELELARLLSPAPATVLIVVSKALLLALAVYAVLATRRRVVESAKEPDATLAPAARARVAMI